MRALIAPCVLALTVCSGSGRDALPPPPPVADADADGRAAIAARGDDCNDLDARVHPGSDETCDGRDEDCDGVVDEDFECVTGIDRACGAGWVRRCGPDCRLGACEPSTDCAASGGACSPGDREACDSECGTAERVCDLACRWGPCAPPQERCNGRDDDCDGQVDEGLWGPARGILEGPTQLTHIPVAAALTEDGSLGIALSFFDQVGFIWADPDSEIDDDLTVLWDENCANWDARAVAAGAEAVVSCDISGLRTGVAVIGAEGVRAQWTAPRLGANRALWTGEQLLIVDGENLRRYSLEGELLNPVETLPDRAEGEVALFGDQLVFSIWRGIVWYAAGAETGRVEYPMRGWPFLAAHGDHLIVAYLTEDGHVVAEQWSSATQLDWTASRALHEGLFRSRGPIFEPYGVSRVDGGWLVLGGSRGGTRWLSGWWIAEDGSVSSPAEPWVDLPLDGNQAVATDGSRTWVATKGVSVIELGCVDAGLRP